jgi:predicted Zn-dependent protease
VYGFSRDIERNADREGFALTARAGYDVSQANRLFERMKREIEAEKKQEPYFLGTHPRIVERIESYNELMAAADRNGPPGDKNAETFQARVKKLLLDNAELDMQIERYEKAEIQLKRYAERYPGEAAPFYLLGEANRRRLDGEHDKKAGEYYRKALSLDPAHADSHKMLGTMLYKARDLAAAREHLQAYLSLKPEAADRAYIEGYIRTCDQRHQPAAPDSPGR